jgi:pimeloyl-ACP methyl ester carboxylesterase
MARLVPGPGGLAGGTVAAMPHPSLIEMTPGDLSAAVLSTLEDPPASSDAIVSADGIPFFVRSWGDPASPPLLLIHGITASSRIWWRIGPALAVALGRHVLAPDQAGHGRTGHWAGNVSFRNNAGSIAALVRAADADRSSLQVVGHSWGAMTAAWLPSVGLVPEVTVLLDPPAVPLAVMSSMLDDPVERAYDDLGEAIAALGHIHPTWSYGDVEGKAEALTQLDEAAVRAVLTQNGDWDAGLAALDEAPSRAACIRLIRGEPAFGGLVPDDVAQRFVDRLGTENVITIPRGTHSPMRQHVMPTLHALIAALRPPDR